MKPQPQTPAVILHGSQQPFISVARHYGGMTLNGVEYLYLPVEDAFLRKDMVKAYTKHRKAKKSFAEFVEIIKENEQ